jgi:outer membrane protein OmpA-like peptidoglycan-associated protein
MHWCVAAWFALSVAAAWADDLPGSKDHPLLDRYPGSYIAEYRQAYDALEMPVTNANGGVEQKRLEGDVTVIRYFYDSPETQASPLQLMRNYQNAIKAIGGAVVYERLPSEGDGGETVLTVDANGKSFWIKVAQDIYGAPTQNYQLQILELAAMTQVVKANELWDELSKNGFVTLYINFDTGKSDLKPDGMAAVKEIVALMAAQPALALSIEGHTDNVGNAASNKTLSQARAQRVMDAVIAQGVAASRLSASGFGQESPIADNRTETGRAKNRRVELVKK